MATISSDAASWTLRLRSSFHSCVRLSSLSRNAHPSMVTVRPQKITFPLTGIESSRRNISSTSACYARLITRPQRPYQFSQIVQLSDGSTFTVRTTSPHPLYRCTKDSRNHIMWQPSEKSLRNVELDEAGKLAAFRSRFGRGWDATRGDDGTSQEAEASPDTTGQAGEDSFDTLADLLSGYATAEAPSQQGGLSAKEQARKDKKKK